MDQIIQFVSQEWLLVTIFAVLLVALVVVLIRERSLGGQRLDPSAATRLINKENALVIDLRDQNAFAEGHVMGAKNIPHTRLEQSANELSKYKNKPIILVCDMGRISPASGALLRKQGFEQVFILAGGVQAWRGANLPLSTR